VLLDQPSYFSHSIERLPSLLWMNGLCPIMAIQPQLIERQQTFVERRQTCRNEGWICPLTMTEASSNPHMPPFSRRRVPKSDPHCLEAGIISKPHTRSVTLLSERHVCGLRQLLGSFPATYFFIQVHRCMLPRLRTKMGSLGPPHKSIATWTAERHRWPQP
jgi:hypothetical protein